MSPITPDQTPSDDATLLSWLASRDAQCPVCGYNLRGLAAPGCPECGAGLALQVGSPNLTVGPWLVGVLSLGLAVGLDGVTSLIFLLGYLFEPPPAGVRVMMDPVIAGLIVMCGGCLASGAGLVVRRRRFWQLDRRKQWRIGVWLFAVVTVVHAAFGLWAARRMGFF